MAKFISVESTGNFNNLFNFLESAKDLIDLSKLDKYGQRGVEALREASPKDTGLMASSWSYKIDRTPEGASISWHNDDIENGVNIAILVQYGHATKNGSWVEGIDYINPALKPIFDEMANDCWEEVRR